MRKSSKTAPNGLRISLEWNGAVETPNPTSEQPAKSAASSLPARTTADCWNKIGVNGNASCPELTRYIHCRNCPVYSAAGADLLNREPPANYLREWTEHFSREKKRVVPGKLSAVIFRIAAQWLALPTHAFQEVAEDRTIHTLPHRQDGLVLGLVNFRGELLVCVSLSRLLGIERHSVRERPCKLYDRLVITEWQGNLLTFPAHEVCGIHRYNPEELQPLPAGVDGTFTRGLLPWGDKQVWCLDEEPLFSALNRSLS
jgi:chemotaxis-related protein WspD